MTLLSISQNVLKRNKASEIPPSIINNNNDTAKLIFQAVRDATYIVKDSYDWQKILKKYSFNTISGISEYDLPNDIEDTKIVPNTGWNFTTKFQLEGPVSLSDWQLLLNWGLPSTIIQNIIVLNNKLNIYPTPSAINSINYFYVSKNIIRSSGGSEQSDWLADTDYSILNEYAIELQATWLYLKQLGRPYEEEKVRADNYLTDQIRQDGSRKIIGTNMREIRPFLNNASWLGVITR